MLETLFTINFSNKKPGLFHCLLSDAFIRQYVCLEYDAPGIDVSPKNISYITLCANYSPVTDD